MTAVANRDFVDQVRQLLATHLPRLPLDALTPEAHLTFDLGMDSVELMQLLVLLETEAGYAIPEHALDPEQLQTLADLERLMTTASEPAATVGEPELDVKVHCVVSCLCHPVKRAGLDHRPFYFGVWDAEVFVDEQARLRYHADDVDHGFFFSWFERLYGAKVVPWYDHRRSKSRNIEDLESRMRHRAEWEYLMVMLDLYRLPERENRFQLNPFPHYVLLEDSVRSDQVWMWDPDFRWEGTLDRRRVMHAVESPAVAGGYTLNVRELHEPEAEAVAAYFEVCFQPTLNGLTHSVEQIIQQHLPGEGVHPPSALGAALAELPVLAIRKYAYEHGLAYFWRALGRSADEFEQWCDVIEALVKGYEQLLYQANKWAMTQKPEDLAALSNAVAWQNEREHRIKRALFLAYNEWRQRCVSSSPTPEVAYL